MTPFLRLKAAAVLVAALFAPLAHAGLFDDAEARRAILDLRAQIDKANEDRAKADADAGRQVEALRRSILDLNTQIELMRGEIAKLRGTDETLVRDISEVQRAQRDVQQSVDARVSRLEPQRVVVDNREVRVEAEEKGAFDAALALLQSGDFPASASAFQTFQRRYPGSQLAPSVQFWLGNALYGKRDYAAAMTSFRTLIGNSPDHPRVPEAMLSVANCQLELRDNKGARATLSELLKKYPQSEAAAAGRDRIASIR